MLRREVRPGETVVAGGRRARWWRCRSGRTRWTGDERQRAPEQCPGPDRDSGTDRLLLRGIPGHRGVGRRHRAVVRHPAHAGVGGAAGAIAAVSAAGASAFFSPQPTSTSTAAIIMVFFIVAPDTLGFGTAPESGVDHRRCTLPPGTAAEPKPGQRFVKPDGGPATAPGTRASGCPARNTAVDRNDSYTRSDFRPTSDDPYDPASHPR